MAYFRGTLVEFYYFLGPLIRNKVNYISRHEKNKRQKKCEHCSNSATLEAAHIKGRGRKDIIKEALSELENSDGLGSRLTA